MIFYCSEMELHRVWPPAALVTVITSASTNNFHKQTINQDTGPSQASTSYTTSGKIKQRIVIRIILIIVCQMQGWSAAWSACAGWLTLMLCWAALTWHNPDTGHWPLSAHCAVEPQTKVPEGLWRFHNHGEGPFSWLKASAYMHFHI